MSVPTAIAPVRATGDAGTTRLLLELVAALATDGHDVTVPDAAFATQGLPDYVSGTLDPDATALVTDAADMSLEPRLIAFETNTEGHIAVCPAAAPFEWLAQVMTPDIAWAFEGRTAGAADGSDHVLVDAPLLASSQTVVAAAACDRVMLVAPATDRGADTVGRLSTRVADIDTDIDAVIPTFGALDDADVIVSETEATGLTDAPVCRESAEFVADVTAVAEVLLDIEIDAVATTDGILGSVSEYVRR